MKLYISHDGVCLPASLLFQKHGKNMLGKYFSVEELSCGKDLLIALPLVQLLDAFREKVGCPVKINSGYRTTQKQAELKTAGFKAASISPHTYGMAADIDTASHRQTLQYVRVLKEVAEK